MTNCLHGKLSAFDMVAEIMGWSASTAIRMAKRYGHIGQRARTDAVAGLCARNVEGYKLG
jgi:hypothetical protein